MREMKSLDLKAGLTVLRVIQRHTPDHPILAPRIEEATGVNQRTVTDIVSLAAEMGVKVGSGPRGYFGYHTAEGKAAYVAQEKKRLISLGRKLSRIKRSAANEISLFEQDAA